MENNIRIPVDLKSNDKLLTINIEQEFDNLEVLSLKISSANAYNRMCSDYGCLVGRVQTNSGFGLGNAKINIFVPITNDDKNRNDILQLYPFETINDKYPNGVRYNLLPRIRNTNPSHRAIGNFPDISDFSQYPQYVEIFEKYYKYTTTTNDSGDYMILGIPLGTQNIIMDFDLFDTNSFDLRANDLVELTTLNKSIEDLKNQFSSQITETIDSHKVPNFIYHGNNNFDIEVKTNISDMPNIFNEIKTINISPFWGDDNFCDVGITRCDFKIDFKYQPNAIFFGYLNSLSSLFSINKEYKYTIGKQPEIYALNSNTGITDGDMFPFQEPVIVVYKLDDKNNPGSRSRVGVYKPLKNTGVFRITLPMYEDYFITNEFGDLVPTNDSNIGIATSGHYAFEIYETSESWYGRRYPNGGYENSVLPGIRIPSSLSGDRWAGGWEGTWRAKFEYDLINKKRKFYTIQSIYSKHDPKNVLAEGNNISYFPITNIGKVNDNITWNFPIDYNDVPFIDEVSLIGSVLIPRFNFVGNKTIIDEQYDLLGADRVLDIPYISPDQTFNQGIHLYEWVLGIGVKINGTNSSSVYTDLFSSQDFIINTGNGDVNIFGTKDTWNFGDNAKSLPLNITLFASEISKNKDSTANAFDIQYPYTQAISDNRTHGVFINASNVSGKKDLIQTFIYDITDDIEDLVKNKVYTSFNRGDLSDNSLPGSANHFKTNLYNDNFYYFGMWDGANALKDIESFYFTTK